MSNWSWVTLFVVYLLFAGSAGFTTSAGRIQNAMAQERIGLVNHGDSDVIEGSVILEQRRTLGSQCQGEICSQADTYWALIVDHDGVKYELDERFHLNQDQAPEYVELHDIKIRPGTFLRLEAQVLKVTDEHFLVQNLRRLDLQMD